MVPASQMWWFDSFHIISWIKFLFHQVVTMRSWTLCCNLYYKKNKNISFPPPPQSSIRHTGTSSIKLNTKLNCPCTDEFSVFGDVYLFSLVDVESVAIRATETKYRGKGVKSGRTFQLMKFSVQRLENVRITSVLQQWWMEIFCNK